MSYFFANDYLSRKCREAEEERAELRRSDRFALRSTALDKLHEQSASLGAYDLPHGCADTVSSIPPCTCEVVEDDIEC